MNVGFNIDSFSISRTRNMKRETFRIALRMLVLVLAIVLFMGAGDDLSTRFNKVGNRLRCRCGYCDQGLLECNHVGCSFSERARNELQAALQRGDSDDLILQTFVQKYGPVVLAAPTTTGFNRIAWIMPFVALSGGLLLVVLIVKAWNSRRGTVVATSGPTVDPATLSALRQRVHEETEI